MEDKRWFLTLTMAFLKKKNFNNGPREKLQRGLRTLATPLGLEHLCLVDEYSVVLSPTLITLLQTYPFCCEL